MKRALLWGSMILVLSALFTLTVPVWGQDVTAAIVGTVSDPSGAPINGATVRATDTDRGTVRSAQTNETGSYSLTRIPVGNYKLEISAPGFQKALFPPFTLVLNQTARLDAQMKVGQVSESIEVTGAAPVLKTETTEVDTVIDARTNDNLPLATRNPVQLTLLAPGSVTVDTASLNLGSNTAEGGGRPYINGNREQANNFLLDGVDNNQVSENRLGLTPSPDAIQEFNLITNNASAEFGNFQGGIVNTTIKSGTNKLHGNAFEFFRNDIFNANKWENGLGEGTTGGVLPKPKLRWNMFGGTLGGPIVKNKLFFFADYQGGRLDHPASASAVTVLTPTEVSGNFSALLNLASPVQLYNPCASGTGVSGNPCVLVPLASRAAFPGNIIPSTMINAAFTNLATSSLYPQSVTPIDTNGFGKAVNLKGQQYNTDQGDIKIDYNASDRDRVFGRYSQGNQNDPNTNSVGLLGSQIAIAHLYNSTAGWTHTFRPDLVNDFRFGYNDVYFVNNNYTFSGAVGSLAAGLGINGVTSAGLPLFGFGGGTVTQPQCGTLDCVGNNLALENFTSKVLQFNDSVIYTRGRHIIKSGFQLNHYGIDVFYAGNGGELGMLLYNGQYTAPGASPTGQQLGEAAAADFALGLPSLLGQGVAGGSNGAWHQRDWLFAGYVQDTWRVTNSLTLNLGLRYEARTPWTEANNRQVNVNIQTGALEYPGKTAVVGVGTNGFSAGLYNSTYGLPDFQPRIGFAWSPTSLHGRTVVRGAYTVSSYLEGTGTNLRLTQNPPNTPPQSQASNSITSGTTLLQTEAGPGAGSVPGGNPFMGATLLAWDKTVQPAMSQQWNMTVQQEVANNTTFQLGYVGQHGTHLMVPEWITQGVLQSNGTVVPSSYVGGPNPAGGFGPNQLGAVKLTASVGNMKYNALQAVLQKRYSHGLETQVSYTYSKCMTDNSGYFGTWSSTTQTTPASPYFQNLYNPRAEWAQCYWDSKHVLSAYAVYELPVGRGKQFGKDLPAAVNAVVGNWSVNPIVSWHTGFPLALYGTDVSGTGSQGARPNCNDSLLTYPKTTSSQGLLWFDPSFATTAPAGTFGNCPAQGPVIGPHYSDIDVGLQKNFPLTETMKLQFRADMLNTFNHPNFAHPNMSSGYINTTQDARQIQFALKFYF
jgi:Carboxypeptidase regulatory-like domain